MDLINFKSLVTNLDLITKNDNQDRVIDNFATRKSVLLKTLKITSSHGFQLNSKGFCYLISQKKRNFRNGSKLFTNSNRSKRTK